MTTANAIEAMTDAGEFEILATRVLRHIDADYARVEHLGVNADGKTVKNPADGFTRVPGTKPFRYVMAAFSTDQAEKIEKKLLFNHTQSTGKSYKPSDDGDLIKASRLAQDIRVNEPDAEFVFTFCTNKQPNDVVMQSGYDTGRQLGIEVRFLARSTIRDHLDTTPEGQWLRKQHLGISADILSLPLLRELASNSVSAYLDELFCSKDAIVETATTKRLLTLTSHGRPSASILTGPSGSGKSIACYRLVSEVIAKGGIGLWLPAEIAAESMSLDEAITKALQVFYPTLDLNAGRLTQTLTAQHKVPLVIVVDDVNRTGTPSQVIHKLISWNHRAATAGTQSRNADTSHDVFMHMVIPAWNHFWNSIASRYRDNCCVDELSTQPMTADEAHACLQAWSQQSIGRQSSFDLAHRLEFDPILIGLWGKLYGHSPSDHLDAEPRTLIAAYIQRVVEECSADGTLISADIYSALDALADRMLAERELYPRWSLVAQWLNDPQLNAVRKLCVSGGICRVVKRDAEDRFVFRHDRLLEAAIAKPLGACLRDVDGNRDMLSDPYFIDSLAHALVSDGNAAMVPVLIDYAPLAVLRTLCHLTDTGSEFAKEIMHFGGRWLMKALTDGATPPEIVFAAADILISIKNPMVLTVTEQVKEDHRFSGARLVNGDVKYGKFFVAGRHFYPSSRAPFIEDPISDAKRLHLSSLCEQLACELHQTPHSKRELHAALILAGYLGDSSLAEPVLFAWKHDKDNECLVEALWASLRCSTEPDTTLAPILDSWAMLSNVEDQHGQSERTRFVTELTWCMRHGVNDNVVEYLVRRVKTDERLSHCLTTLLADIDHPIAVGFVACELARIAREIEGTDRFSPWTHRCREKWDPLSHNGKRLSDESRSAILSSWKSAANESEKKSLLSTWVTTTDSLEELLELPEEYLVSTPVLRRRARLGEQSCVDSVLELLEDNSYWWEVIPSIWTERIIDFLDTALSELGAQTPDDYSGGRSDNHYHLSFVLRDIPVEIAEGLLLKHWELLKFSPLCFQTALYIGGDTLISACQQVLVNAPDDWKPFEYVGMTFGFNTLGLQDRLTYKHIDALRPFIAHVHDMELMDIADWLVEHGREDLLQGYVLDEIMHRVEAQQSEGENSYVVRQQRLHFPSNKDLLEALDGAEKDRGVIWRWCHYATKRGDSKERLRKIIQKWFDGDPTPERLEAVAKIFVEIGERTDVLDLQDYQSRYGNETTKVIVDGAAFVVRYRTLS